MITYQIENTLTPGEFRDLLIKSTLGERRPVDDLERINAMVRNANLIFTARDGLKLVAVARSITDFVYCTYLSDLAVDNEYQKQGIGKELIRLTIKETPNAKLILLAAPGVVEYYSHIGMTKHIACYVLTDGTQLK